MADVEQFLNDCKTYDIGFNQDFLEYINHSDDQAIKLKELYNQFIGIIETEEINESDLEQLEQCLIDIEKVFIHLKKLIETHKENFILLKELGKKIGEIFVKVEYVYDIEQSDFNILNALKENFLTLDLESLQETIEILKKIIKFKDKNEEDSHFSDTALEIKYLCKNLGSLDYEFLPYVLFWKLPPRLLQLYKSAERTKKKALMFTVFVKYVSVSSYFTKARETIDKIHKKYLKSSSKPIKIGGSSGLKLKYWSLEELKNQIKSDFYSLLS